MILQKVHLFWIIRIRNWFVDPTRAAMHAIQLKTGMIFMLSLLIKLHLDKLSITVLLVKYCKVPYILTNLSPSYIHGLRHCLVLVCPIVWPAFNKPKGRFLQDRITSAPLLLPVPICTHAACQARAGALHSNTTNPCLLYATVKPHTKYIPHDEDKTNSVDLSTAIDQWQQIF